MTIFDTYSKRKKRAEQAEPDVYQYDRVPATLRNQIQRIWEDAIGPYYDPRPYAYGSAPPHNNAAWHTIRDAVCREKGKLTFSSQPNPMRDCIRYLHSENTIDDWFDLIEFSFLYIDRILGKKHSYDLRSLGIEQKSDDAIEELNFRLLDAGVGYQFESGQIIRIDSEYVHSEIVKPALVLLSDPRFAGAQEEFLAAHDHYRSGEYRDCVVDALNAFESTLKIICNLKDWEFPRGAGASGLIKVVRREGLLPDYLEKILTN